MSRDPHVTPVEANPFDWRHLCGMVLEFLAVWIIHAWLVSLLPAHAHGFGPSDSQNHACMRFGGIAKFAGASIASVIAPPSTIIRPGIIAALGHTLVGAALLAACRTQFQLLSALCLALSSFTFIIPLVNTLMVLCADATHEGPVIRRVSASQRVIGGGLTWRPVAERWGTTQIHLVHICGCLTFLAAALWLRAIPRCTLLGLAAADYRRRTVVVCSRLGCEQAGSSRSRVWS